MISRSERPSILCVDDEPAVLQGLTHHLRRAFRITTATSGPEGLKHFAEGDFAVVISDMRMPQMYGATFLNEVRSISPSTVRVLLTGFADMQSASKAVNHGQVFRFLTKPCAPSELRDAVDAAVEQHRLVEAERVLLEQTLRGSVNALVDILALTAPTVFGRANRLKRFAAAVAEEAKLDDRWQIEMAAMLSQIGYVVLPAETAERMHSGADLSDDEKAMIANAPRVIERVLGHIPRLEPILEIVVRALPGKARPADPVGARVLRLVTDFDLLESRGFARADILATLRAKSTIYDPQLVEALARSLGEGKETARVELVEPWTLRPGMILAEDVRLSSGVMFLSRGHEVTEGLIQRILNLPKGAIGKQMAVVVP